MKPWVEVWSETVQADTLMQYGGGVMRLDVDGADMYRVVATDSTGAEVLAVLDKGNTEAHVAYGGPHNPPVKPQEPVLTEGRRLVLQVRPRAAVEGVEADVRVPYQVSHDQEIQFRNRGGSTQTDTRPATDSEGRQDMREAIELDEPDEPIRSELQEWWEQQTTEGQA